MATEAPPKDFDVEEEREEEDEEEEEEEAAPAPPPPPPKRKSKKDRKSNAREDRRAFQPQALTEFTSTANDAEDLVVELIDALGKPGTVMEGKVPYDVELRTYRITPAPNCMVGTSIDLSACCSDETQSPADKFIQLFDDYVHMPSNTTNQSCTYKVTARWKASGKQIASARINRQSNTSIMHERSAQMKMRTQEAMGNNGQPPMPPANGVVYPSYPQAQQQPQYPQPPPPQPYYPPMPGYYPHPYQQEASRPPVPPPGMDPRIFDHFTATQRDLIERLNAAQTALAEAKGQPAPPPVQPPPVVVAPQPPPVSEEEFNARIARGVIAALQQLGPQIGLGLGAAPPPQAPLPPPPPPVIPPTPAQMMGEKFMGAMMQAGDVIFSKMLENMGKNAAAAIGGAPVAAAAEEAAEAVAEIVKPEDPASKLPFEAIETLGRWPDQQKVIYTPAKDGSGVGGLHVAGFLSNNPFVVTKAFEIAGAGMSKIMEAVGNMAASAVPPPPPPPPAMGIGGVPPLRPPVQQPTQVVSHIPSRAVDANPHPPSPPPPPPAPAPPPSAAPDDGGFSVG